MTQDAQETSSDKTAIRPFRVGFPEADLTELRRRVNVAAWEQPDLFAAEMRAAFRSLR